MEAFPDPGRLFKRSFRFQSSLFGDQREKLRGSCRESVASSRAHGKDSDTNGNSPFWVRACLHGGGGPQVGEITRLGGVTRFSI